MSTFVYAHWKRPGDWTLSLEYPDIWIPNPKIFFNIQERSRRILFNDYESDVHHLLDSVGDQTLALRWLKYILLEVYKCIKKVNTPCLHNLVNSNTILHQVKNSTSKLERFRWFQGIFKYMEWLGYSPSCDTPTLTISNSLWTFLLCVFSCELDYFIQVYMYFFFHPTTVHLVTALYIFAPYSRMLVFWLMLLCLQCDFK